jgi:hypothetical protein
MSARHDSEPTVPGTYDVLLGRGAGDNGYDHNGNQLFRCFLDGYAFEYALESSPSGKLSVVQEALRRWKCVENSGRFLVRHPDRAKKGMWVAVVDDKPVLAKIENSFRDFLRKVPIEVFETPDGRRCIRVVTAPGNGDDRLAPLAKKAKHTTETKGDPPPPTGFQRASETKSLLMTFDALRLAFRYSVPVNAQEAKFYADASSSGLNRCESTELGIFEKVALFRLGREHGLELSDGEAKLLNQIAKLNDDHHTNLSNGSTGKDDSPHEH